jgi:hypothetical protein
MRTASCLLLWQVRSREEELMNLGSLHTAVSSSYTKISTDIPCVPHDCLLLLQVRSREEELMNLGSLHTATKAAADKRIAELERRVSRLLEANRCGLVLRCVCIHITSAVVCISS